MSSWYAGWYSTSSTRFPYRSCVRRTGGDGAESQGTVVLHDGQGNGPGWAGADPGTAAVLHGMMAMLSEVLDGLDRRLSGLETAVRHSQEQARADMPAMVEEAAGAAL